MAHSPMPTPPKPRMVTASRLTSDNPLARDQVCCAHRTYRTPRARGDCPRRPRPVSLVCAHGMQISLTPVIQPGLSLSCAAMTSVAPSCRRPSYQSELSEGMRRSAAKGKHRPLAHSDNTDEPCRSASGNRASRTCMLRHGPGPTLRVAPPHPPRRSSTRSTRSMGPCPPPCS